MFTDERTLRETIARLHARNERMRQVLLDVEAGLTGKSVLSIRDLVASVQETVNTDFDPPFLPVETVKNSERYEWVLPLFVPDEDDATAHKIADALEQAIDNEKLRGTPAIDRAMEIFAAMPVGDGTP